MNAKDRQRKEEMYFSFNNHRKKEALTYKYISEFIRYLSILYANRKHNNYRENFIYAVMLKALRTATITRRRLISSK